MNYYVYSIQNIKNNKKYIGSTANDPKIRWSQHLNLLRKGKHKAKHLQRSWNLLLESDFCFTVIEETPSNKVILLKREEFWISHYNTTNTKNGYNSRKIPNSNLGIKFGPLSKSHREKVRKSLLGRDITWGDRISKAKLGRSTKLKGKLVIPRETRICACGCGKEFMAKSNSKHKFIHGHNMVGIVPWSKGKTDVFSKEALEKISKANKGHKRSYGNQNHLGHSVTQETKERMRESRLAYLKRTKESECLIR